jgi:hypothetical protein
MIVLIDLPPLPATSPRGAACSGKNIRGRKRSLIARAPESGALMIRYRLQGLQQCSRSET